MAVLFNDKYWFFHIPKCGGTSVRSQIGSIARSVIEAGHNHGEPIRVMEDRTQIKNSFTVIREPVSWYRSFYAYRMKTGGWKNNHFLDRMCKADTLEGFCLNVLNRSPYGYLTDLYCRYIFGVEHVLMLENIDVEFPKLMEKWGFGHHKITAVNVTNSKQLKLSQETQDKIFKAEKCIYKMFYNQTKRS